jgi:peptide-methionine (S)-S-oxide reductase
LFLIDMFNRKTTMPSTAEILPGRAEAMEVPPAHAVSRVPLKPPYPDGFETAFFAMGKFWGAEKRFWGLDGVYVTAVGYSGGTTPNPTYQEVATGLTGHAQTVMVVFDPASLAYADLLAVFFESHDPTQGMRQGSDIGTFFRSAVFALDDMQASSAQTAVNAYQSALASAGLTAKLTTRVQPAGQFFFAEAHHQQYLARNPGGQSGLKPVGVPFPRTVQS